MIRDQLFENVVNREQGLEFALDLVENVIGSPTTKEFQIVAIVTDEDGSVMTTSIKPNENNASDWDINQNTYSPMEGTDVPTGWASRLYDRLAEELNTVLTEAVSEQERASNHDIVLTDPGTVEEPDYVE